MYLVEIAKYLPSRVVDNDYFSARNGKDVEWMVRRTGMHERRRAGEGENTHVMAVKAVSALQEKYGTLPPDIDLIVGCTYTPWDTLVTISHVVQHAFGFVHARAMHLSSACSSFLSALEMTAGMMESGRSKLALIVLAEHNSLYAKDDDSKSGHLWGDGAAAVLLSAQRTGRARFTILDIVTNGLAHIGKGIDAIQLIPSRTGLVMSHGRDIFEHSVEQMVASVRGMLGRNGLKIEDIKLLVPHQANRRILDSVARHLGMDEAQMAVTVDRYGNTGCASIPITLSEADERAHRGDCVLLTAFGGGYSSGSALLKRI